ncbi:hypothetical protein [Pandoraea sp. ISTKB]|uniref:hypothetical protein n=1 Tax=Pandoraea sp. ISTKB TaxID=1586708 RepID=UPI000847C225|nr:hypothetical protein [Pandoraea sp. ISTKB]ODP35003.1 hypothetical protein A9762_11600 [Pandoraea sp. ISTKB]
MGFPAHVRFRTALAVKLKRRDGSELTKMLDEKFSLRFFPERFRVAFPAESVKATQLINGSPKNLLTSSILNEMSTSLLHAYNADILALPFAQRPMRPTPLLAQAVSLAFSYAKFFVAGRQIYEFGPEIRDALVGADHRDIPLSALTLPFQSVYLHFGPQGFTIKGAKFEGAYVSEGAGAIEILLCTSQDREYSRGTRFTDPPKYQYLAINTSKEAADTPLGDIISRTVASEISELKLRSELPSDPDELPPGFVDMRREGSAEDLAAYRLGVENIDDAMRLVVNSLLFVSAYREHVVPAWGDNTPPSLTRVAEDPSTKPKLRQAAKRQLISNGYYKVNFVGTRFDYTRCAHEADHGREVRPHWRRAHWRLQHFGEGRQESRMVLIRQVLVNAEKLSAAEGLPGRISEV